MNICEKMILENQVTIINALMQIVPHESMSVHNDLQNRLAETMGFLEIEDVE